MPGTSNQELLQKATITTDALASAGKLNPEQAEKFLDFVEDETQVAGTGVRFERFRNEQMLIEKLNVANRVALPFTEATDPAVRRGVSTSKVTLQPKEIMVPFEVSDLFKDYNVEGMSVEEHIIKMMATRLANNMEELFWDGNALGPAVLESDYVEGGSGTDYRKDSYLALFDGWLKQAEAGHVVDAANGEINPTLISRALRAMPNKFRKNRRDLVDFLSWDHEQAYREGVSTRATGAGDSARAGTDTVPSFGVNLRPISLLDPNPLYVEHITLGASATVSLSHANITDVVVSDDTLAAVAATPYVENTDYTVDLAAGTITNLDVGIGAGAGLKITYRTGGKMLITRPRNMITAVGRDIAIERDRNIYRRVNEYAIHARVYCCFEETDAVVLVKNVKVPT
jgi:hypothetical protein